MNGLRARAKTLFYAQPDCWTATHTLHCVAAVRSSGTATTTSPYPIYCPPHAPPNGCQGRLQKWLAAPQGDGISADPDASVRIVMIDHEHGENYQNLLLGIHRVTFESLFSHEFGFDDYLLYLLLRNVEGFYEVPIPGMTADQEGAVAYYLCIRGYYTVIWTAGPGLLQTNAIVICRPDLRAAFQEELNCYADLVGHPLMLALVCASHLIHQTDEQIFAKLRAICFAESETKVGQPRLGHAEEIELGQHITTEDLEAYEREDDDSKLGRLSALMSNTSVKLELYQRHLSLAVTVISAVINQSVGLEGNHATASTKYISEKIRFDIMKVSEVLLKSSLMTREYVAHLIKRADIQHIVLSTLIARQDATAAISLAEDSKALAVAAVNDSFSMKTIAVVTMLFLPATFFAAVFAMPIMEWSSGMGAVMSSALGLYVGLTVAVTITVFITWWFLTQVQARRAKQQNMEQKHELKNRLRVRDGGARLRQRKRL